MYRPNGRKLERLRTDRNLSALAVGAAVGLDHRMILRWERGEANDVHLDKFHKLAEFYGFKGRSMMDLLLDHSKSPPAPIPDPARDLGGMFDIVLRLAQKGLTSEERQALRGQL